MSPLYVIVQCGAVDFSSEIAMPLDSTEECAEERGGLKAILKLCALRVLRGGKSLDFQTVPCGIILQTRLTVRYTRILP